MSSRAVGSPDGGGGVDVLGGAWRGPARRAIDGPEANASRQPVLAAGAARAVGVGDGVADLAGKAAGTAVEAAVEHDTGRDAGTDREVGEVAAVDADDAALRAGRWRRHGRRSR